MNLNWKRLALLIGFIAAIILLGYLLYYFLLRPAAPIQTPSNQNANANVGLPTAGTNVNIPISTNAGALPPGANIPSQPGTQQAAQASSPIATGGLTKTVSLTTNPALGITGGSNGIGLQYYDKNSGLFYRIDSSGKATALSNQVFYNVSNVTWSPNKNSAILEYPDGSNILYNFSSSKQITLPRHWKDFNFSPNGNQVIFKSIGDSVDNRWLAIASPDGSNAQTIEALGNKDETVYPLWSPNSQMVAMYSEDQSFDQQNLYFVGLHQENFKSLTINGRNFQGNWSPNGDELLYSVYNTNSGYRPTLWIASSLPDTIGNLNKSLNINTWADKCTFSDNNTVYCAVPGSLTEGAGMFPDDLDNQPTDIYKINLNTGFKSLLATPDNQANASQLTVSADGQYLYFVNKFDNKIYQIKLK